MSVEKWRSHLTLFLISLGILIIVCPPTYSQQEKKNDLLQFSGVVMTNDSLRTLPFVNILIKNTHHGTMSNYRGFFSLVAERGDTILFSSVGYENEAYAIPDTLSKDKYSIIQLMSSDTVNLPETVVHPWPSRSQFENAFINLDIPDDDIARARQNLARKKLKELQKTLPKDAREIHDRQLRQQVQKLYHSGQYPPISILNPAAWSKFINALEEGKFK